MTARELIAELQALPDHVQDMEVFTERPPIHWGNHCEAEPVPLRIMRAGDSGSGPLISTEHMGGESVEHF